MTIYLQLVESEKRGAVRPCFVCGRYPSEGHTKTCSTQEDEADVKAARS